MPSPIVSVRVPEALLSALDEFAAASGWSRGETIVYALEEFCPLPVGYVSRIDGDKPVSVREAKPKIAGVREVAKPASVRVEPVTSSAVFNVPERAVNHAENCRCYLCKPPK